jgi:hypothetical protein
MENNISNLMEDGNMLELSIALDKVIDSISFTNDNFILVVQAIAALINNNYLDEANNLIERLYFQNKYKQVKKVLLNMIEEEKVLNSYTQEKLNIYNSAITLGRKYYNTNDTYSAYDAYLWGYYVTHNYIFLYYIGKMFYKNGLYDDLVKYITKSPASKASKAYLYLGHIQRKNHRFIDAYQYMDSANILSIITDPSFYSDNEYDPRNKDKDSCKFFMQRYMRKNEFTFEDTNDEVSYIKELLSNGNEAMALRELKKLEKQDNKSEELKRTLNNLKTNMKLYKNKNRS